MASTRPKASPSFRSRAVRFFGPAAPLHQPRPLVEEVLASQAQEGDQAGRQHRQGRRRPRSSP